MATTTVNHSPKRRDTASIASSGYEGLALLHRAALAREMAGEVLDHYDHASTLVTALVEELRHQGGEDKAALHLATIAEAWLNDKDHVAQKKRLTACLTEIEAETNAHP